MYILYIVFFLACIPTLYGKCLSKMCLIWITSYIDFGTLVYVWKCKTSKGYKNAKYSRKVSFGLLWKTLFLKLLLITNIHIYLNTIHNNSIWLWELSVVSGTDNILQNSMLFYGWIQLLANILKLTLKSTYKIHLYIV